VWVEPLTVSVPDPPRDVYPTSPVIAVNPTLRVNVVESMPYVASVPRDGVVAANAEFWPGSSRASTRETVNAATAE
jgi:hypothetical protein